jgi:hypothetical protein
MSGTTWRWSMFAAHSNRCRGKKASSHDPKLQRQRHWIENFFARRKDWRRSATLYGKCNGLFFSAICIDAAVMF